jgi:hypothetical protein
MTPAGAPTLFVIDDDAAVPAAGSDRPGAWLKYQRPPPERRGRRLWCPNRLIIGWLVTPSFLADLK